MQLLPLVSVTSSIVVEEDTVGRMSTEEQRREQLELGSGVNGETKELLPQNGSRNEISKSRSLDNSFNVLNIEDRRRHIPSASSALVIGGILGLIQAVFLITGANC